MSDSHVTVTVDSTVATPEDTRSQVESTTSFGATNLRSQQKEIGRLSRKTQRREEELRTNAISQAERFLEWSKEWTSEKHQSIGSDLRYLVRNDPGVLDSTLWAALSARIEFMQEALFIAAGETLPDDSSSASGSEGSNEMEE